LKVINIHAHLFEIKLDELAATYALLDLKKKLTLLTVCKSVTHVLEKVMIILMHDLTRK
jgi:hypothetical protein